VVRVPRYATQKKNGTVVADVTVEVVVDTPVIAVIDGKYGFGQTVTPQAVRIGIDKCRKNGLSAVTLRNAGHVGRVGDWAEMAAAEGLVSVHFVNASGSVLVAPSAASTGASRPRPIASASRGPARIRWCSTSRPRSSPRARCWSRARAARRSRRAR
jgi:LDH2 family malate/lactate/ureidoglycolate dehydrogenase